MTRHLRPAAQAGSAHRGARVASRGCCPHWGEPAEAADKNSAAAAGLGVGWALVFEVVGQGGAAAGAEEHGAAGAAPPPDAADLRLLRRAQRLLGVRADLIQVEIDQLLAP